MATKKKKSTVKKIKKKKAFRGAVIPKGFVSMNVLDGGGLDLGKVYVEKNVYDIMRDGAIEELYMDDGKINVSISDIVESEDAITADPKQQELAL